MLLTDSKKDPGAGARLSEARSLVTALAVEVVKHTLDPLLGQTSLVSITLLFSKKRPPRILMLVESNLCRGR